MLIRAVSASPGLMHQSARLRFGHDVSMQDAVAATPALRPEVIPPEAFVALAEQSSTKPIQNGEVLVDTSLKAEVLETLKHWHDQLITHARTCHTRVLRMKSKKRGGKKGGAQAGGSIQFQLKLARSKAEHFVFKATEYPKRKATAGKKERPEIKLDVLQHIHPGKGKPEILLTIMDGSYRPRVCLFKRDKQPSQKLRDPAVLQAAYWLGQLARGFYMGTYTKEPAHLIRRDLDTHGKHYKVFTVPSNKRVKNFKKNQQQSKSKAE